MWLWVWLISAAAGVVSLQGATGAGLLGLLLQDALDRGLPMGGVRLGVICGEGGVFFSVGVAPTPA